RPSGLLVRFPDTRSPPVTSMVPSLVSVVPFARVRTPLGTVTTPFAVIDDDAPRPRLELICSVVVPLAPPTVRLSGAAATLSTTGALVGMVMHAFCPDVGGSPVDQSALVDQVPPAGLVQESSHGDELPAPGAPPSAPAIVASTTTSAAAPAPIRCRPPKNRVS